MAKKAGTSKKTNLTYRLFFVDDEGGNKLQVKQNDKLIVLTLLLKNDKPRRIGVVTRSTRTLAIKRKVGVHLFRKISPLGGWGFCHYVLNNQNSIDFIRLSDDMGNEWSNIPVKFILENGKFLFFKEQGFEKQIFVSLEQLAEFKITPEQNRRF